MTKDDSQIYKGIAIILMLFHHLFNDFEEYAGIPVNYWPFSDQKLQLLAVLSKICVAIFVFITGYGLSSSFDSTFSLHTAADSGTKRLSKYGLFSFIWKRWWKLMTNFWFVFLIVLLLQPLGRTVFDAYGTGETQITVYGLIDFFGFSDLFHTPTINPTWWYMSFAVTALILTPLILCLVRKAGNVLVPVAGILVLILLPVQTNCTFYLFSLLLGIMAHKTKLFIRIQEIHSLLFRILVVGFCTVLVLVGIKLRLEFSLFGLTDACIVLCGAVLVNEIIGKIPFVRTVLYYLGKYSMNMFFFHTMLYSYYFTKFFYGFTHWFLILTVLTAISFILSWLFENLKTATRYNYAMEKAGRFLFRHLSSMNTK